MKVSDSPYIKGEVIAELCNLFLQTQLSIKEDPSREEPLINWARPYYNEIYKLFEADITEEEFEYIYFENLKAFFEQRTFFIFSFDIHTFLDKLRNLH
jgi:molybdopterin-guanine dinucleotide biosynthesis protein A